MAEVAQKWLCFMRKQDHTNALTSSDEGQESVDEPSPCRVSGETGNVKNITIIVCRSTGMLEKLTQLIPQSDAARQEYNTLPTKPILINASK